MGRIDGRLIRRGALILLFLGGGLLFAACATPPGQPSRGPAAAFDASPTSGNSPLPVTFTDKSTGTITGWQWDFGDTATSTAQSPTHTYDAGGTYTVSLTVTGPGGMNTPSTNTTSKTITVNAPPVVSITAPPDGTTSAPDLPVTFTGSATDPEDGNLAAGIKWSSSIDGALGSGASLTTSGLSSGTHTITAAVTDSAGATGTATITVVVNAPPGIGITSPETGATYSPSDAIPFTGSATDLEDGVLSSSIQWSSSKDGALGTGASITSPLSSGAHTITASVTDSGGKTATQSVSITVNAAPTVSITAPGNGALYQFGDAVPLTGTASDTEDGDLSGSIQWTSSQDGSLGSGSSINPSSLSAGSHVITASVTDTGGKPATTSVSITVNAPPDVAITGPQTGALYQSGAPVTLTGTASDSEDGDLAAAIQWSSSRDGALGTGASINASSLSAGSHVITASVTDTGGKTVTSSITVTVNAAPVVTITSPPNGAEVGVGDALNLTGTAMDLEDGNLASSMQWSSSRDGALGTGASINASSLSVGSHTITASVTDTQGGTNSKSIVVTVTAPVPPQASFSFSPTTGTAPLLVSFTDTSTGDITSWAWTFTSGTGGSTGPNVTHTFPTPGAYTATLTVSGLGGSSSATRAIVVTSAPPVASFTATPSIGIAPLTVSFTDHSTGSITSWAWSFSDGGSASGQNVNHTFTTPGTYTATLSVTGPGGTSQFSRQISVLPASDPGGGRDPGDPGGGRDPGDPGGGRDGPPPEKIPG